MDERAFYVPIFCGVMAWAMFSPNTFIWSFGIFLVFGMIVTMIDEIAKFYKCKIL